MSAAGRRGVVVGELDERAPEARVVARGAAGGMSGAAAGPEAETIVGRGRSGRRPRVAGSSGWAER